MSQDISPTLIVSLKSKHPISCFFCIFPMSQDSIMILFPVFVLDHFNLSEITYFLIRRTYSENPNFLVFFIFPSGAASAERKLHHKQLFVQESG